MTAAPGDLPDPVVSAGVYDEDYYRGACAGADEWVASGGARVHGLYAGSLAKAGMRAGDVVVDIGTGRGELLAMAVRQGARRAIGVEYSPAAVALAEQTLAVHDVRDRAEVLLADARAMPIDDGTADLVTMLDVVEHLSPEELHQALCQARRILRPGGRVFVHTMPNRTIYEVTYRWQRALVPRRRRSWPSDPRNDYERLMHVNEQTVTSLRRALRAAGFRPARVRLGEWVHTDFVPDERARRLYHRLRRVPGAGRLVRGDLWGEGTRPA